MQCYCNYSFSVRKMIISAPSGAFIFFLTLVLYLCTEKILFIQTAAIGMNSVFSVHKYKTNIRKKINAPEAADIVAFLREKLLLH